MVVTSTDSNDKYLELMNVGGKSSDILCSWSRSKVFDLELNTETIIEAQILGKVYGATLIVEAIDRK